jgi:hypothetical protein
MAHDHHHHGESLRDYFTEQLFNILVVGAFGLVAVLMYRNGMVKYILAPQFWLPLLLGGIGVLAVVAVRALSVWREAGEMKAHHHHDHAHEHHHDHEHGPDCDHDHHHHDHNHDHSHAHTHTHDDHGHSHDLSWTIARMLILFFPIALFWLGLPNAALVQALGNDRIGNDVALSELTQEEMAERAKDASVVKESKDAEGRIVRILRPRVPPELKEITLPDGKKLYEPHIELNAPVQMSFNDLNDAAFDEAKRRSLDGQGVILEGRLRRLSDREFTLYRLKMTCCAADTVPLKVRIVAPQALSGYQDSQWVRVTGRLEFVEVSGSGGTRYVPVVRVPETTSQYIRKIEPLSEYE